MSTTALKFKVLSARALKIFAGRRQHRVKFLAMSPTALKMF